MKWFMNIHNIYILGTKEFRQISKEKIHFKLN
ncbi:MAG: hypothetical protein MRERC_9c042 [Mycoplasmataceae bacterium RC_NB112A]|nr:MAG: hypothetical protein MRERC_9c042 [Mycoplasmataceae bacterium RC_NB112A]